MSDGEKAFYGWFTAHWPKPSTRAQVGNWEGKRRVAFAAWVAGHTYGWNMGRNITRAITPSVPPTHNSKPLTAERAVGII